MLLNDLAKTQIIKPPEFVLYNTHYLTMMGSHAYGAETDDKTSDMDIYGFCIPPKEMVFPHLDGHINGFGTSPQSFNQWQEHHVKDNGKEYDFSIYSIIKYFQLCMDNNPNFVGTLFTPRRCILHTTSVGEMVRENRKLFLHAGSYYKFKGYSFAQMNKIVNKKHSDNPKRQKTIEDHGYDTKHAYHVVRLLNEAEQILTEGDLDLERNREQLKSIRRGEWTLERLVQYFEDKERQLEQMYADTKLQRYPDEDAIKNLLLNCLEHHYGSLGNAVVRQTDADKLVKEIQQVLNKYS